MKRINLLMILLISFVSGFADYKDSIKTNVNDLSFSTQDGYDVIRLENVSYINQVGVPQLPIKVIRILIPIDKKVDSIRIDSVSVQALNGKYHLYPVQAAIPMNIAPNTVPFDEPDTAIYDYNTPFPAMRYEITNDGYPMGYHVITLTFYPLEYIPSDSIVNVYSSIYFTLHYIDNQDDILRPIMQSKLSNDLSKTNLKNLVMNYEDINAVSGGALEVVNTGTPVSNLKSMTPSALIQIPDYVIITCDSLKASFQPLADWKTQKGINTIITTVEDIYSLYQGSDNAEKIRNYLKDVYVNFGSSFVLLGGDVGIVPARFSFITVNYTSGYYECDLYFATVQGNWNTNGDDIFGGAMDEYDLNPVFYVGRAPVQTNAEVNVFVNKVMGYETLKNTTHKNYVQNLAFFSADGAKIGECGDYPWQTERLNAIDSSSQAWLNPENYFILKLYDHYNDSTSKYSKYRDSSYIDRYFQLNKLNVVEAITQGWYNFNQNYGRIHLLYHGDHSGFDGMGTSSHCLSEHISRAEMHNLSNGIEYSQILYSDGCETSQFSKDALPEEYLNNPNGGGVAFLGNSANGVWGEDTFFVNHFMYELYSNSKPEVYKNEHYYLGNLHRASSFYLEDDRIKRRILFGDPSMMVWSATPTNLTVTNVAYSASNKSITGTLSGLLFTTASHVIVTVCAWKGTEIYVVKEIDATTANVNFVLSDVIADTPGDILVTVTAHNYIPKIDTIHVTSINGAHPYLIANTINDYSENNDGFTDAGETVQLHTLITNSGNTVAPNVTGVLTWDTSQFQSNMIAINTSTTTYGNITAGNNAYGYFVFTVDKDAFENITPRPMVINAVFTLDIYLDGILYSSETLNIPIHESHLIKGENIITGSLTEGSTNELKIKLYNTGIAQAIGTSNILHATLTTNNPTNITITNGTDTYTNINGVNNEQNDGINNSTFTFVLGNQNYSNETFNLSITDKYGKIWTFNNFNLIKTSNLRCDISHHGYENSISLSFPFYGLGYPDSEGKNAQGMGYNIYRSTNNNGPYTKINETIVPYCTYLDENLEPSTIYYYKITLINYDGNESDFLPASGYLASTTVPMHSGWPLKPYPAINIIGNSSYGSPNVYDVDNDNEKEIFFTTGSLSNPEGGVWAFNPDGTRWYKLDTTAGNTSGFINLACHTSATPAIADLDNDGHAELAVTTHRISGATNSQKLMVYKPTVDNNNDDLPDKYFSDTTISGWEVNKGAVLADIDNNGTYEILVNNQSDSNHVGINIFNQNGNILTGWQNSSQQDFGLCGYSMPVAFDFNNDGVKEIVIGCTEYGARKAGIYIYKEDGTNYGQTNPVYEASNGYRTDFPPVIADINNDSSFEIIFISAKTITANLYAMKSDGTPITGWDWNSTNHPKFTLKTSVGIAGNESYMSQLCPNFSVGDLNKDGFLEVVCGDKAYLNIWEHTGGNTPIKKIDIENNTLNKDKVAILADIDEDEGDLEIIITNTFDSPLEGTDIFAYKMDGTLAKGFPITIDALVNNSPCVDDIDNDGMNELIVSTGMEFYVWDSYGNANNNVYGWKSYRRDNLNSGVFYNETCNYSSTTMNINSNKEWEKFQIINENVVINSGASLKITSEIRFNKNATITIKPGGKLIIDGGTLTNACTGELWQGIFVEGNPNDSTQADSLQGVVELINGAVIQNAECGINVGLEKLGIAPEMCAAGGGIVRATDASFINNKKAVEFGPYNRHTKRGTVTLNRNASYFRLCTFKVDNNALFSLSNFKQHVNLLEVREVAFEGCSFESINHTGSAIQSLSSGFILRDYNRLLLNGIRSRVSNFNTAIQIKDGGTKASSINNTNFYNNNIGILAEGTDAMYIQSDSFNIPYNAYFGPTTGVTLTKCSKFEVNDNYFNGENNCNYGLIIIKSGINSNIVEHNYFNHLSTACIAYGKNSDGENGTVGLQYYCNWFENNNTDIYVGDYENETGTIRYIQGENNNACNNVFSINGTSLYSMNFPFQYYCKNSIYNNQIARNISSNIDTVYKLSDKCNQIGIVNPDIQVEIPGDWEITKGNEYSLINGMLTSVKNQYAGYNYINLDWGIYYNGNPVIVDSLVYYGAEFSYDTTIYYTDGRDPLDTIMTYRVIDSIVYYYNYIVPEDLEAKVNLYFQINDLQSQVSEICQEAMYYIHSDSIVDLDVYHEWLLLDNTPEADYVLSESYYEEGNYLSALNTLNTVSTKHPLYDENEYTNYVNLYNVKDSLRIKTMSWDSIEESSWEMITLNNIANSGINSAAFKAQAIETGYYSSTFETTVPFTPLLDLCMYIGNLNEERKDSLKSNLSIKNSESTLNNIIIYPNPTNDKLTVKSEHSTMTTLCMYDVIGKEIRRYTINEMSTVLDVTNLCKGIYFLKIETENGTVTKRFVKE